MRRHTPRQRKLSMTTADNSEFQLDFLASIRHNVATEGEGVVALSPSSQTRGYGSEMTTIYVTTEDSESQIQLGDEIQPSKRKTYPQDWPAYNTAQTSEKETLLVMLADLCANVQQPLYGFGRPRFPLADMVYVGALKVYSGFSARRFDSDVRDAHNKGFIDVPPSFNTVNRYIANPDLTPILIDLIERSAAPLNIVESQFAADSSGFSTCRFDRWFDAKWGKEKSQRQWLKAHILTGTQTNIVTAIAITPSNVHDSPVLPQLLDSAAKQFKLVEVSADKAYLSDKNLRYIEKLEAYPYIPFKKNTTGKGSGMWRRLYAYFMLHEDTWQAHYHKRSNVETTFSMVKGKFGDSLRSKSDTGQVNEILLKFLCHNICVLIQEMHELGITPDLAPKIEPGVWRN